MASKLGKFMEKYDYDKVVSAILGYGAVPFVLGGSVYGAHEYIKPDSVYDTIKLDRALFGSLVGSGFGFVGLTVVAFLHPITPFIAAGVPVYAYHKFKQQRQLK